MTVRALILGSLGTLAELAEPYRRAVNLALGEAGAGRRWDRHAFGAIWAERGAAARLSTLFGREAAAIDAARRRHMARLLEVGGVTLRPGIAELIGAARTGGAPVALASSAHPDDVDAVLDALGPSLRPEALDWIGDATRVVAGKPAPDIYHAALGALGVEAAGTLAVEDRPVTARAARAAGLDVLGFPDPGVASAQDFPPGILVVDRLRAAHLRLGGAMPGRAVPPQARAAAGRGRARP